MYGPNIPWAKCDGPHGLFQRSASGSKTFKPQMEFHPPPLPMSVKSSIPPMASFFTTKIFFWRPVGVLDLKIRCPNARCTAPPDAYLAKSGFSTIARQVRLMFMYYLFVCVHVCSCVCVILFAWLHDPISNSQKDGRRLGRDQPVYLHRTSPGSSLVGFTASSSQPSPRLGRKSSRPGWTFSSLLCPPPSEDPCRQCFHISPHRSSFGGRLV